MATSIVGAYWGSREESRKACAERLFRFFRTLKGEAPGLDKWFRKMSKKTDPVLAVPDTVAELAPLLSSSEEDARNGREYGFTFGAWRGFDAHAPASFGCDVGNAGTSAMRIANRIVITCDDETTSRELLRAYLKAVADAFDPDDAVVHDGVSLEAAQEAIKAAEGGRRLTIVDPPAIYRYKRGFGFSWEPSADLRP